MLKTDALLYFGSKTKLAQAAGIRLASLYSWKGDLVPEGRAMRLSGHHLTEKYVATTVA
ncbi:repressor protein of division inhibition gene [Escherichia coli]|uniref:Repressor protein of division inhibition protein n=1 Tax=Escherichia coli TaxID=562 RepID=A0A377DS50_ECOLX|nr:Cro/CI family transcriptional regulator [Escherichia coli]MBS9205789.1 hypothetical protein [Escherichia coli]STM38959.1 repressor protein of division inhibition gene [Escherichia coli]HEI3284952.1 hypothetical protein [Escherichia coli]